MDKSSLFLVQSMTDQIWYDLEKMAQSDDCIVIMGDAAAKVSVSITDTYAHIYCLSNEHHLLNDDIKDKIQRIDYAQFADLTLQFKRCISLK